MSEISSAKHLVFFDGKCGMCRRTIHWIQTRDKSKLFKIIAFQEAASPPMTDKLREDCRKAIHIIKIDGEILRAGRAMLFIFEQIGIGFGLPAPLQKKPLIWLIEIGYKIIAANRNFFSRLIFTRNERGKVEKFCALPKKNKQLNLESKENLCYDRKL